MSSCTGVLNLYTLYEDSVLGQHPRRGYGDGPERERLRVAEVRAAAVKAEAVTVRAAAVMATAAVATAVAAMDDQYCTTQMPALACLGAGLGVDVCSGVSSGSGGDGGGGGSGGVWWRSGLWRR